MRTRRGPAASEHEPQHLHLVQALTEAQLVASRQRAGRWGELADRLDRILEVVGTDGQASPDLPPRAGLDPIARDTFEVDEGTADRVVATLGTLSDGQGAEPQEAVLRAVGELEAHLPRRARRSRRAG